MITHILILEAFRLIAGPIARAMHDPLRIFKAAEILSDAIVFAGLTALATSIIASFCTILVTVKFTRFLKSLQKAAVVLLCLIPLGLSGCGGWGGDDCYWWHRHRHFRWESDGKSESAVPVAQAKEIEAALGVAPKVESPPVVESRVPGPFGGITAVEEFHSLKQLVVKLADRPVVCLCGSCGKQESFGPRMFWRINPLNPAELQYGYELGGFFYVISVQAKPQ
jgi:hypothetical protein